MDDEHPRRKRVVTISDLHCGHEFGLTPPAWQYKNDGHPRIAKAAKFQRALWSFATEALDDLKPIDVLICNGDAIDGKGDKSGGIEQITTDRLEQCEMAAEFINYAEAKQVRLLYGCLTAGHKILTSDLKWVPVESLSVGDELLAFDEHTDKRGVRRYQRATVEANTPFEDDVYDLILSDGSRLTANGEHPFLMRRGARRYEWVTVEHLFKVAHPSTPGFGTNGLSAYMPMPFPRTLPVWDEDQSYEAGYLAGFFDGEGCINQPVKRRGRGERFFDEHGFKISATQKPNVALQFAENCLSKCGFKHSTRGYTNREEKNLAILGGIGEQLRFLGKVRPWRLLKKFAIGKLMSLRANGEKSNLCLVDVRRAGKQTVYGLQTSSRTYFSNGFLSHNTRYHVGKDEDFEQVLAERVNGSIQGHGFFDVNGCIFDVKHKVGSSSIPHGRMTALARARLWNTVWSQEHERQPKANIIQRSHVHYFNYAGGRDWLAMTVPALSYGTSYGIRECEGIVDIGMIVVDIDKAGGWRWNPLLAEFNLMKAPVEFL